MALVVLNRAAAGGVWGWLQFARNDGPSISAYDPSPTWIGWMSRLPPVRAASTSTRQWSVAIPGGTAPARMDVFVVPARLSRKPRASPYCSTVTPGSMTSLTFDRTRTWSIRQVFRPVAEYGT